MMRSKEEFAPNWQGSFIVKKALPGGTLMLAEMEWTSFPSTDQFGYV